MKVAETDQTGGQAVATADAPADNSGGQSVQPSQTTDNGSGDGGVESFFDPKSIEGKPELQAAYKQMQGAWTKAMQRAKEGKSKAEAYDQFVSDPQGSLTKLAQQYGYQLVQRNQQNGEDSEWAPKSWDDVLAKAKEEVIKEMEPVFGEMRQMRKQNVEAWLDANHSDWRMYEDEMVETLKAHPSLANDPSKLYRLAVPDNVIQQRAFKEAQAKLKATGDSASVSGSGTKGNSTTNELPKLGSSLNDHVEWARQKLKVEGLAPT